MTNSVSSHCHTVSNNFGQNVEQDEEKKHTQQPVEDDQRPFCLWAMVGMERIVSEVHGSQARPDRS